MFKIVYRDLHRDLSVLLSIQIKSVKGLSTRRLINNEMKPTDALLSEESELISPPSSTEAFSSRPRSSSELTSSSSYSVSPLFSLPELSMFS